jgi:hypothetical protein
MIVFVVFKKSSYEGCSEPLAVFDTLAQARIMCAGAEAAYGSLEIKEMIVNEVSQ